jgi:hypothetical protein
MAVAIGCFRNHKITDWLEIEDECPHIFKMTLHAEGSGQGQQQDGGCRGLFLQPQAHQLAGNGGRTP